MFDYYVQWLADVPAFVAIMARVVSIWGFLNFINQLHLQNKTSVADRALGRLPILRIAINGLDKDVVKNLDDEIEHITEVYRKLFIDLKQLGIAHKYKELSDMLLSLVHQEYRVRDDKNFHKKKLYVIDAILRLEKELMNIFDMSYAGQNFISHLSRNIVRVTWISLIVYLIQIHRITWAVHIFFIGIIIFQLIFLMQV